MFFSFVPIYYTPTACSSRSTEDSRKVTRLHTTQLGCFALGGGGGGGGGGYRVREGKYWDNADSYNLGLGVSWLFGTLLWGS